MEPLTIHFVGDVMLGELLENYLAGVLTMTSAHFVDPFEHVKHLLRQSDLCVANLECVITDSSIRSGFFGQILRAPKQSIRYLVDARINVVNVANNHAHDHGKEALKDCVTGLQQAGIHVFGYSPDGDFQTQPLVIQRHSQRVGFLGFDIANFRGGRLKRACDRIEGVIAAERSSVDCLVLSLHWGEEYVDVLAPSYCDIAKRMLDAGCDVLYGHHSHRLQGVLRVRDAIVAPSLGNFVFDDTRCANRLTAILRFTRTVNGLVDHAVIPCVSNLRFQPVPVTDRSRQIDVLHRKLQHCWNVQGEQKAECEAAIHKSVRHQHQLNRLRLRIRMLWRWRNYQGALGHIMKWWWNRRKDRFGNGLLHNSSSI